MGDLLAAQRIVYELGNLRFLFCCLLGFALSTR